MRADRVVEWNRLSQSLKIKGAAEAEVAILHFEDSLLLDISTSPCALEMVIREWGTLRDGEPAMPGASFGRLCKQSEGLIDEEHINSTRVDLVFAATKKPGRAELFVDGFRDALAELAKLR